MTRKEKIKLPGSLLKSGSLSVGFCKVLGGLTRLEHCIQTKWSSHFGRWGRTYERATKDGDSTTLSLTQALWVWCKTRLFILILQAVIIALFHYTCQAKLMMEKKLSHKLNLGRAAGDQRLQNQSQSKRKAKSASRSLRLERSLNCD